MCHSVVLKEVSRSTQESSARLNWKELQEDTPWNSSRRVSLDQPSIVLPDMGTNEQIMTWIKDTYQSVRGEQDINAEGCCTGKYISQGGIAGRAESTGLGVYFGLRELMTYPSFYEKIGVTKGLKDKTFVM